MISLIATVGNDGYGFNWHLYLDGSIEFEVKLTGMLSTGAIALGEDPLFGTVIAPGLFAPNHHYFSVRLDMRVDSDRNNLFEVDSVSEPPGPGNPHGNAWRSRRRQLMSEAEAQRPPEPLTGRAWLVRDATSPRTRGRTASSPTPPAIAHRSTAIWWSGTRSGRTTSCVPRIGR